MLKILLGNLFLYIQIYQNFILKRRVSMNDSQNATVTFVKLYHYYNLY